MPNFMDPKFSAIGDSATSLESKSRIAVNTGDHNDIALSRSVAYIVVIARFF